MTNDQIPMTNDQSGRGFTTIELLVSIGILVILSLFGLTSYQALNERLKLETISRDAVSTLHRARDKTVTAVNDSQYGVHFESDRYVSFKGAAYDPSDTANFVTIVPSSLELYDIAFEGGANVLFDRITGRTSNSGTVKVRIKNNPTQFREIKVLGSGHAGFANAVTPTGTRVTDSRHLHFDLGWSIRDGVTLMLVFDDFPNPNVVASIPMASYFNAGNTEFNFEGTVDVNGQNQTLKIHTHSLTVSDTVLSVHRDRRLNNKPLDVSIDLGLGSLDIVSYTGAGAATVGAWGGVMSAQ